MKNFYLNLIPLLILKIYFKIYISQFRNGQQDAKEFIRTLLEDISKENNRNKIIPDYE